MTTYSWCLLANVIPRMFYFNKQEMHLNCQTLKKFAVWILIRSLMLVKSKQFIAVRVDFLSISILWCTYPNYLINLTNFSDALFPQNGFLFAHASWCYPHQACLCLTSLAVWLHVFILHTISLSSSSHICRSRATALQCKLQSRRWSCGLSRGVRWGEAPHKRLSLSLSGCVCGSVTEPSVPIGAQSSIEWRSQAELAVHSHSSHCNSASGLQSYDYHSLNVPQTEHPGLADTK